jgi:hypothetical protein
MVCQGDGAFFQRNIDGRTFWTAAASEARRRFGNKPTTRSLPKKALSLLRSASAVQKLRVFANDAQFENKPYGEFRRPR